MMPAGVRWRSTPPIVRFARCRASNRLRPLAPAGGPIDALLRRIVDDRLEEERLRKTLPSMGAITDETSLQVRAQYEENPYPRWFSNDRFPAVPAAAWFRANVPGVGGDIGGTSGGPAAGASRPGRRLRHREDVDHPRGRNPGRHGHGGGHQFRKPRLRRAHGPASRRRKRRFRAGRHPGIREGRRALRLHRRHRRAAPPQGPARRPARAGSPAAARRFPAGRPVQRPGEAGGQRGARAHRAAAASSRTRTRSARSAAWRSPPNPGRCCAPSRAGAISIP